VYVCVFVRDDISGTTRAFFIKFFVHVAYGRGSVLLWQDFEIPMRKGNFGGFSSLLYNIAYKKTEQIEMLFGMMSGLGQRNSVAWGDDPQREGEILGENVPDKFHTTVYCELDWSIQRRAHDSGRRLIASVGGVYYRP